MPRTETCKVCGGTGEHNGATCPECGGNGYVPKAPVTAEPVTLESVQRFIGETRQILENDDVAPLVEPEGQMILEGFEASIDLTDDTPAPGRMANQTWRILEEQKQAAEETIREAEAEIDRWSKKRADAARTVAGCVAGQAALEGGA